MDGERTPSEAPDVTRLLAECRDGADDALERLFPIIYDQLRGLADRHLAKERGDHTLQPTALVHEAWIRLVDQQNRDWRNRSHFLCVAAMAMRRILVNHAVAKKARKRGGTRRKVELDEALVVFEERAEDLVALDEALKRLEEKDERKARVVEMRFFAGLGEQEIAESLGVTTRTVERDWRMARAWLKARLEERTGE
ncbi:MAG: sigma-70 family RNA polymerase sigma factor [Planctomycetota bacterium JB042]